MNSGVYPAAFWSTILKRLISQLFEDKKEKKERERIKSVDDKQIYYLDSSCKVSYAWKGGRFRLAYDSVVGCLLCLCLFYVHQQGHSSLPHSCNFCKFLMLLESTHYSCLARWSILKSCFSLLWHNGVSWKSNRQLLICCKISNDQYCIFRVKYVITFFTIH